MSTVLNASGDYLSRTTRLPTATSFTMMGWVNFTVINNWHCFFTFGKDEATNYYAMLLDNLLNPGYLSICHDSARVYDSLMSINTWYHMAMTVEGTGANQFLGYRDGLKVLTASGSAVPTSARMWLGNDPDTDFANVRMAHVKIYAAPLSQAEIIQEMWSADPVRKQSLNGYYPLRGHNELHDWSGLQAQWTVGGTLTTDDGPPMVLPRSMRKRFLFLDQTASVTAAVTGSATASITEADVVTGGKTIIITLTGDTWVASGATFDAQRQNIINGLTSATASTTFPKGWNAVVKALQSVSGVVRTSDTVVTITLDAFVTSGGVGKYNIPGSEVITPTIPGSALAGGVDIVASPAITIVIDPMVPLKVSQLSSLFPERQ